MERPLTIKERALDVFSGFGFAYFWSTLALFVLRHVLTAQTESNQPKLASIVGIESSVNWHGMFQYLLVVPLGEELVFRVIPLMVAMRLTTSPTIRWSAAIAAAVAFAGAHLHKYELAPAMLQLTVMGIVAGALFLSHAARGPAWKAWLSCATMHGIYSFTALSVSPF